MEGESLPGHVCRILMPLILLIQWLLQLLLHRLLLLLLLVMSQKGRSGRQRTSEARCPRGRGNRGPMGCLRVDGGVVPVTSRAGHWSQGLLLQQLMLLLLLLPK